MTPELPLPDPHETFPEPGMQSPLPAPTAVFVHGSGSAAGERVADRWLDVRPGLLVVLAPG